MAGTVVTCPSCSARNRLPASVSGRPRCAKCKADLPWVVEAGDNNFDRAIDTGRLVLVDLWAPWCGPCRMVSPILEKLAADFAGRLKVVKVNVDNNQRTAQTYRAMSIPMLVFLRRGTTVDTIVGAQPESVLRGRVESLLAAD